MPKSASLIVVLVATLSSLFADKQGSCADQPQRPNIVFIMADDLGHGHLGCYGQQQIQTPHIDRLASEGMRFTQAYAGCAVCAPCRSVLMTGLHMGHTAVRSNSGGVPLADEDITLAEVLKARGYGTGGFGKWGLGDHDTSGVPYKQGFDLFFGYLHQVHAHFYYPQFLWRNDERVPLSGNTNGQRGQYSHDEILHQALTFIRQHKDEPFFCYMPLTIPHLELVVPEDSLRAYRGKFPEKAVIDPRPGYITSDEPFATYAGMISRLDDGVGQVMALLKELGLDEKTLVIFTSDNGTQGGGSWDNLVKMFHGSGNLRGTKGSMYEGGIRVPAMARWPGKIRPGQVSDFPWYFADVLPTLAELTGAPAPAKLDGISLVPTLLGQQAAGHSQMPRKYLYWELGTGANMAQAVRMGRYKGVRTSASKLLEVYDLVADESETRNLAAELPEVAAQMAAALSEAHVEARPQVEPDKPAGKRYR